MAKKNPNSLGIHRRKNLLRICHALGLRDAPMWSNKDIIHALAHARGIEIGLAHQQNADIVLRWFERNEPVALAPKPKTVKPHTKAYKNGNLKDEFYKSWEWRTVRMVVLKKHGHRCQSCGAKPEAGNDVRLTVDHIKPLSKYWELRLDPDNLQVLCDECNMGKGAWDETDYR